MEMFAVSLLNGTIYGLLLFLIAAGLTLDLRHVGRAQICSRLILHAWRLCGVRSVNAGRLLSGSRGGRLDRAAIGAIVERYMLRSVHAHGHEHALLLTFGLLSVFDEVVKCFFGYFPVSYQVPEALSLLAFRIGSLAYPAYRLFMGAGLNRLLRCSGPHTPFHSGGLGGARCRAQTDHGRSAGS